MDSSLAPVSFLEFVGFHDFAPEVSDPLSSIESRAPCFPVTALAFIPPSTDIPVYAVIRDSRADVRQGA